jgi:heme/copper-type cytochrome/quinol oxidase subunit 2
MEVIVNFEYLIIGAVFLAILSTVIYKAITGLYSSIFVKHIFIFIDENGRIKEIIEKRIKKGKNNIRIKGIEYCFEPNTKYHLMAFDEKNELFVKKDRTLDSAIKSKAIEEYELMAINLLGKILQSKIRGIDLIMLLMMGIILAVILMHFMGGGK